MAASADFSKLILQSEDRALAGASGTVTGEDLYEYAGGALHRVNVNSEGKKLGAWRSQTRRRLWRTASGRGP